MTFKALITEKTDDGYRSRVGDKNLEELPEGDVLVRVAWSSLNYKDALSASGNKGVTRSFPHTPGIDAAGVVEEAGDGPFSVGDAVICTGYDLGMNTSGGYGDYIRVPAEWLAPLPAGLSARDAMVLGTAGLTAALCVEALIDTGLQPEQGEVLVTGATDAGILYGAFALLRHLNSGGDPTGITLESRPRTKIRILDHWDNLDGSIERGYAGRSLWDWWTLPDFKDPRYADYARANASIGINGAVLNNVNASAQSLTAPYIAKAAALADVFRPYEIRVYLSARFSAPVEIGGLKTADPRVPEVAAWWRAKADEIYRAIPDFGGFLVKANSEGQPGPRDYGASHAEGANMLAAALRPHGGIVMWRAFVYADSNPDDRAKQAYDEFKPLDGSFADNVVLQAKNGPIDFQPREPFHPLFGAMPKTRLTIELQTTKEYLGFATHLAYLGPLFEEVLDAPTGHRRGETVASVVTGEANNHSLSVMAGVANIGRDRDWSGSTFNQANWYVFGRLAWDPALSSEAIAREWAAQTFGNDAEVVSTVVRMMMRSREAVVDYTGPLGLAHLFATDHHYGPGPWISNTGRADWNPVYYHRADRDGIGFDRTASGSNAIAQYAPSLAKRFARPETTPVELLLWFHHLPWDYKIPQGGTLWEEMVRRYDRGVAEVRDMASSKCARSCGSYGPRHRPRPAGRSVPRSAKQTERRSA